MCAFMGVAYSEGYAWPPWVSGIAARLGLGVHVVFVSGSPKLVFSAMDALMEAGLPESQFFSDVLAYATRES